MDHPQIDLAGTRRPEEGAAPDTAAAANAGRATEPVEPTERAGSSGSGEAAEPPARRSPPRVLFVVAVLSVLVALASAVVAANAVSARNRERSDRQAVEEVAGRLATALSTYDFRDFEATKRRVLGLSTGAFAIEYERAVAALASLIEQTKATSEATAGDVFVGNLADGKASAIVVIAIRANGIGGPRVSVDNYVDLSLVKVEGEWKVDGVRNLNLGVSGGGAAGPPATGPATPQPTTAATAKPAP